MMQGIPPFTEKFLLDIGRLQKRSERAQQQLTSGLKVSRISDSPDDISRLLGARSGLELVAQVKQNLVRVKTETDTSEQALQGAVKLLDRARVLGAQGANELQNADTRARLADELDGLLERMVSIAGTAVEGRYVFSGDTDQVAPYLLDPASPKGVGAYQGSAATRRVADANGLEFTVSQSADVIFDPANNEDNAFSAINGMRRALLAVDNPPDPPDPTIPTIAEALHNLGQASLYMNQRLAEYGLQQNRVSESITSAEKLELSLKEQVALIEEADLAEAATELIQTRTNLEAAFQARAQVPRRSLFDYLG